MTNSSSADDWKQRLSPQQYNVLREKGTEAPFSGELVHEDRDGTYSCVGCGAELFTSNSKYESRVPGLLGWPSFSELKDEKSVKLVPDDSGGMQRTEVVCASCGGHLGHVFNDDPDSPSGQHYCINSCALDFKADQT